MTCPSCSTEAPEGSRFCPSCGAALDLGSTPTLTQADVPAFRPSAGTSPRARTPSPGAGRISSSSSFDEARFVPGTTLVDRYRIVALIGKGGMGEVYRAEDLKLSQLVALKFLPEAVARGQGGGDRSPVVRRTGRSARKRRAAPRPEALQRHDRRPRQGAHHRFRPGRLGRGSPRR